MIKQPGAVVVGGLANGTGVVRALGRQGVVVDVVLTLRSDMAHRSRFVRRHHWLLEIVHRPDSLIELLERNAEAWHGWAILPTNDHALSALAKHHERLSDRFRLTCPPWSITQKVVDKSITNRLAAEVGIAVPRTFGRATRAFADGATLPYPVLVKPLQGHPFIQRFDKKLFMVRDERELAEAIEQVEQAALECEIVEFVVGPDSAIRNLQVYINAAGVPLGAFTFFRLRQEPPMFGVSRACETVDAPDLLEPSLALLRRIGWRGIASVSYKTDARSGQSYLMEVNGRSGLNHGLALRAGINYPLMAYSEATSGEIRGLQPNGWRGVWIHLHADFFSTIKSLGKEEFAWREFLRSYVQPKTFAVWAADDPKPFLYQWWFSFKKTPRRLYAGAQWLVRRLRAGISRAERNAVRPEHSL